MIARRAVGFIFAFCLLSVLSGCSEGASPFTKPDPAARPLSGDEKMQSLSVYLPWVHLRDGLEAAIGEKNFTDIGGEAKAIAEELRKSCLIRRKLKHGRIRVATIGSRPGDDDCPILFRHQLLIAYDNKKNQNGENSQNRENRESSENSKSGEDGESDESGESDQNGRTVTMGHLEFHYQARTARAFALAPIRRLLYRGPWATMTESINRLYPAEIVHRRQERFEGKIETLAFGTLPIAILHDSQTRFHGATSEREEMWIRKAQLPNVRIEWQEQRFWADLKPRWERHRLNGEEIAAGEHATLEQVIK